MSKDIFSYANSRRIRHQANVSAEATSISKLEYFKKFEELPFQPLGSTHLKRPRIETDGYVKPPLTLVEDVAPELRKFRNRLKRLEKNKRLQERRTIIIKSISGHELSTQDLDSIKRNPAAFDAALRKQFTSRRAKLDKKAAS